MNKEILSVKEESEARRARLKRLASIIALIIIALGLCFLVLVLSLYKNRYVYIIPLCFVPILIVLMIVQTNISKKIKKESFLIEAVLDFKRKEDGRYHSFKDGGEEFMDSSLYFLEDLDIFGKKSLYKYLNVGATGYGREKLATSLKDPDIGEDEIKRRNEAVEFFASNERMTLNLISSFKAYQASSSDSRYITEDNAIRNLEKEVKFNPIMLGVQIILNLVLIALIVLSAFKIISPMFIFVDLIFNFFATSFISKPIKEVREAIIPINHVFYNFDVITNEISKYDYKPEMLSSIKSKIKGAKFKFFNRIEPWITSGSNILFKILFNSTLGLDTYLLAMYYSWHKKNNMSIREVAEGVSDIEMITSLASLKILRPEAIIGKVGSNLEFKNLTHPLIDKNKVVGNDFVFDKVSIVTGSNMSGKTTFMRTIGVNYLMFKAGGYVLAKEFTSSLYKLFTSMKVVDDTSEGMSTFYAEIMRVKAIMECAREGEPMLVLIDEIFKGTNTLDRVKGATSTIEELMKHNVVAIVTTHDYELCDINGVSNYHFLEHYEDDKILFDYKIRNGKSETRNAIYLMKMAGIIKE